MSIRPKIRGRVSITRPQVDLIIRGTRFQTVQHVENFLGQILAEVLKNTIEDILEWIGKPDSPAGNVPRATGQLRANLRDNLKASSVDRKRFLKLVLGSNLEYAQYVNTIGKKFRHHGEIGYARRFGKRGKIRLNDPNAVSEFFEKLKRFAATTLRFNLAQEFQRRLGRTGVAPQPFVDAIDVRTET
jgi:hypothetical protein